MQAVSASNGCTNFLHGCYITWRHVACSGYQSIGGAAICHMASGVSRCVHLCFPACGSRLVAGNRADTMCVCHTKCKGVPKYPLTGGTSSVPKSHCTCRWGKRAPHCCHTVSPGHTRSSEVVIVPQRDDVTLHFAHCALSAYCCCVRHFLSV